MNKAKAKQKTILVTLRRSLIGRKKNHILSAMGLGLRRINQTVEVIDTPENRGMVNQINYLVEIEENV